MFEFLKKFMTNNESVSAKETNFLHRILNTDIKEEPKSQEDEIIFGCGCFWGAEKCFWKLPGVITCLLYTSPSPRDATLSRMPSSA